MRNATSLIPEPVERSWPSFATFARLRLNDRERALIAYADKLTRAPASIRAHDIAALRAAGLDDRAIHDACAIVAYFAFVNRIADGLGVGLEKNAQPGSSDGSEKLP